MKKNLIELSHQYVLDAQVLKNKLMEIEKCLAQFNLNPIKTDPFLMPASFLEMQKSTAESIEAALHIPTNSFNQRHMLQKGMKEFDGYLKERLK